MTTTKSTTKATIKAPPITTGEPGEGGPRDYYDDYD